MKQKNKFFIDYVMEANRVGKERNDMQYVYVIWDFEERGFYKLYSFKKISNPKDYVKLQIDTTELEVKKDDLTKIETTYFYEKKYLPYVTFYTKNFTKEKYIKNNKVTLKKTLDIDNIEGITQGGKIVYKKGIKKVNK